MTGGRVAALGCGIALLLPGGCFLIASLPGNAAGLELAAFFLLPAGLLFWLAFSRRPGPGAPPPSPR